MGYVEMSYQICTCDGCGVSVAGRLTPGEMRRRGWVVLENDETHVKVGTEMVRVPKSFCYTCALRKGYK